MSHEPLLDEIRQVRRRISAGIGHDPRRIVEYYARLQEEHRARIVDLPDNSQTGRLSDEQTLEHPEDLNVSQSPTGSRP